jgi:hypothetical protein
MLWSRSPVSCRTRSNCSGSGRGDIRPATRGRYISVTCHNWVMLHIANHLKSSKQPFLWSLWVIISGHVAVPLDVHCPSFRRSVDLQVLAIQEERPLGKKLRQKLALVFVVIGGTCCFHLQGRIFYRATFSCIKYAVRASLKTRNAPTEAHVTDRQFCEWRVRGLWWGAARGRDHLGDLGVGWKVVFWYALKIGWEIVDWTDVAQDRDCWRAFVNAVLSLQVPRNAENLSIWGTVSLPRRFLLLGLG